MEDNSLVIDNIKAITFSKKAISISPYYRPIYRIAQICLILELSSRSKKASIKKLHYLSWIMRSRNDMEKTKLHITNSVKPPVTIWRWEPSLNRAITLAKSESMINSIGGKFTLTDKGTKFVKSIINEDSIMVNEKEFLESIGKKISESFIERIVKMKVE